MPVYEHVTPPHRLNPKATPGRFFGVLEISIIKSEQYLDPQSYVKAQDHYAVSTYSDPYYGPPVAFGYEKEVLFVVDLDKAVVSGQFYHYLYREKRITLINANGMIQPDITEKECSTVCEAMQRYHGRDTNLFLTSEGSAYWCDGEHMPGGNSIVYNRTIAYEECSMKYIYSDTNIDEQTSEEYKERYYKILNDSKRRKTIDIDVNINTIECKESVYFYVRVIFGDTVYYEAQYHQEYLNAAIEEYNRINIHTFNFVL